MKRFTLMTLTAAALLTGNYFYITELMHRHLSPLSAPAVMDFSASPIAKRIAKLQSSHSALYHKMSAYEVSLQEHIADCRNVNPTNNVNALVGAQQAPIKIMDEVIDNASDLLRNEQRITALEEKMLLGEEDLQWETQANDEIQTFFSAQDESAPNLEDSYCSGSVCRFELSHKDPQALENLFTDVEPIVSWPHKGSSFEIGDDGAQKRRVYFLIRL